MRKLVTTLLVGAFVWALGAPAAAGPRYTLIAVHEMRAARDHGKPAGAANCANNDPSKETNAYALTGWAASGGDAYLNPSTVPSYLGNVNGALQSAFTAWSGAPAISVVGAGTVTRYTANRQKDLLFGRTGGSIATTYTWRWSDGLIESDVVFNKGLKWMQAAAEGDGCYEDAGSRYDVANIAAHEFGHIYGLDHPSGARFETMYAYGYTGETLKRSPTAGDSAGISVLY